MFLKESSPWICAEMEQWTSLLEGRTPHKLKKGSVIFHQGDAACHVYLVAAGRIRITSFQEDGNEKQLLIAEKGAMFGEDSCILGQPRATAAVTIVESQVYIFPFPILQEEMRKNWNLCCQVMQMMSRKSMALLNQVMELSSADAFQRVARVLMNLSQQYGVLEDGEIRIDIRFTQQDVASLIRASRVTVNNIFQVFYNQGILEKREGRLYLKSPEQLEQMISCGSRSGKNAPNGWCL